MKEKAEELFKMNIQSSFLSHYTWTWEMENWLKQGLWRGTMKLDTLHLQCTKHEWAQDSATKFCSPWTYYATWQESLKSFSLLATCSSSNIYSFSGACNSWFTSNTKRNHVARVFKEDDVAFRATDSEESQVPKKFPKKIWREGYTWNHHSCSRPSLACDATGT